MKAVRNTKILIAVLVVLASLGVATQAGAEALTLTSARYLGSIDPGTPSSPSDEVGYINSLIAQLLNSTTVISTRTFVRSNNTCGACTTALLAGSVTDDSAPFNPIDLGTGYTYLLGKYGNTDHVWLVTGLSGGGHTIPDSTGTGGGLSHWAVFNATSTSVPEPNSLLLIGSGLAAIGAAGRFLRNRR